MDRVQCLDDVLRTYELVLARDTNRLALLEMQIDPERRLSLGDVLVRIDEGLWNGHGPLPATGRILDFEPAAHVGVPR